MTSAGASDCPPARCSSPLPLAKIGGAIGIPGLVRRKELIALEERGTVNWTFAEYNIKFHALILGASGNQQLRDYLEQANILLIRRLPIHGIARSSSLEKRSRAEHARIVKAILSGNSIAAERAMRNH